MNIVLTNICNKRCSFCFAKQFITDEKEDVMNFDFAKQVFDELINSGKFNSFNVLGGEPTKYPHFKDLFDYFYETYSNNQKDTNYLPAINLVSNFLIEKEEVRESIKKFGKFKNLSFLLNVSEATDAQIISISDDINNLINVENQLTIGFTINTVFNKEFYEKKLNKFFDLCLKKRLEKNLITTGIRLSVLNPAPNSKLTFEEFNEKHKEKTIEIIKFFVEWAVDHRIKVNFDCGIPYCFIDENLKRYFSIWGNGEFSGCSNSAFDLFPNGDFTKCYPGSNIKTNYFKYKELSPCIEEVQIRTDLLRQDNDRIPETCKKCKFYLRECAGACVGYCKT